MLPAATLKSLVLAGCLLVSSQPVLAQIPKLNLTIELRQVEDGQAGVYSSEGSADTRRLLQIRVQAP